MQRLPVAGADGLVGSRLFDAPVRKGCDVRAFAL
jgi:hypothetical protein